MRQVKSKKFKGRNLGLFTLAFLLLPFALLLTACAIPMVPYRAVYEDPVNYVRLEVDDAVLPEWPPSAHAHPKAMRAEDVARILGGISVKEDRIWLQRWLQGEAPLMPAFRPEELALLSQQISEALGPLRYSDLWDDLRSALSHATDGRQRILLVLRSR